MSLPLSSRPAVAVAGLVAIAGTLTACGGGDSSAEGGAVTFIVPDPALTVATAPYTSVPLDQGYFEDEELDVTMQPVDSALAAVQAVSAGQGFMTYASTGAAVAAAAQDPDLRIIGLTNGNIFRVVVPEDSEITTAEDLAGATVGVGANGAASELYAAGVYQLAGLDAEQDATFLPVGFGAQAADAFQKGDIDAYAGWDAPNLVIADILGTTFRDVPSPLNDVTATSALIVKKESIEERRDDVVGVARAFFKGMVFAEANPEAAVDIHWDEYPQSRPNEGDEQTMKDQAVATVEKRLELTGGPGADDLYGNQDLADVQATTDLFAEVKIITEKADVEESGVVDLSLVEDYNEFASEDVASDAAAWGR